MYANIHTLAKINASYGHPVHILYYAMFMLLTLVYGRLTHLWNIRYQCLSKVTKGEMEVREVLLMGPFLLMLVKQISAKRGTDSRFVVKANIKAL